MTAVKCCGLIASYIYQKSCLFAKPMIVHSFILVAQAEKCTQSWEDDPGSVPKGASLSSRSGDCLCCCAGLSACPALSASTQMTVKRQLHNENAEATVFDQVSKLSGSTRVMPNSCTWTAGFQPESNQQGAGGSWGSAAFDGRRAPPVQEWRVCPRNRLVTSQVQYFNRSP